MSRKGYARPARDPRTQPKRERRAAAKLVRDREERRAELVIRARAIGLAGLALAAVVVFWLSISRGPGTPAVVFAGDLTEGGSLEALRLPHLEGEGAVEYVDYADRPLVINFFASWCPTCIAEMPEFERVHGNLGDRVAFLGVSQSDGRQASIQLARETGITYDTAIDARGDFFNAIGGIGMPTTIFVRPGGEITEIWVGALNAEALQDLVAEHLGVEA